MPSVKLAFIQLQSHPLNEIVERRADPSCRGLGVRLASILGGPFSVDANMQQSAVLGLGVVGKAVTRGGHAQGNKEFLGGQVFPRVAAGLARCVARLAIAKVGVRIFGAKAARRRLKPQSSQDLLPVVADILQQIATMVRQPAAMAKQVAQSQLARDEWIVHAKAGVMVDHAIVPVDPSLAHQRRQHGRRDRLGHDAT